jgi:hypothetical protein
MRQQLSLISTKPIVNKMKLVMGFVIASRDFPTAFALHLNGCGFCLQKELSVSNNVKVFTSRKKNPDLTTKIRQL